MLDDAQIKKLQRLLELESATPDELADLAASLAKSAGIDAGAALATVTTLHTLLKLYALQDKIETK